MKEKGYATVRLFARRREFILVVDLFSLNVKKECASPVGINGLKNG
jgi:hypothetical protein